MIDFKSIIYKIVIIIIIAFSSTAQAQTYSKGELWIANLEEITFDNLGGAFGLGYDFGKYRIEIESSQHNHLGEGTTTFIAMGYIEPWTFSRVTPYLGLGAGISQVPTYQVNTGLAIKITESVDITIGYIKRCYKSCNLRDDIAVLGYRRKF